VLMEIYESFRRENAAAAEDAEDAEASADTAAGPAELVSGAPGAEADTLEAAAMEAEAAMEAAAPMEAQAAMEAAAAIEAEAEAAQTTRQTTGQQTVTSSRPDSASD